MHTETALNKTTPSRKTAWIDLSIALISANTHFFLLYYVYTYKLRKWEYLGFDLAEQSLTSIGICWFLSLIPPFIIPKKISKLSTFINWFLYFFVYTPAILFPVLQGIHRNTIFLSLSISISFIFIISIPRIPAKKIRIRISKAAVCTSFATFYTLLVVYVFKTFGNSIAFADLSNVYAQRSLASQTSQGTFVGYATGWLSGCFNPLLLSIGIHKKLHFISLAAISGQIFVYMTFAMKSVFLSIIAIYSIYFFVTKHARLSFRGIAYMCLLSLIFPILIEVITPKSESNLIRQTTAMLYMRTYGIAGSLTGIYHEFFTRNPQTYYSHINAIGIFIDYPYPRTIGEMVGEDMENTDMNANANFFATDGLAAAGLSGVILIGIIIGTTFRYVDAVIPRENTRIACAASLPAIISMSNASFFTTLLTGGFGLLVVYVSIWRDRNLNNC